MQGIVKGGRRHGRQRKRWEDNIREWTGLEFAKSQRAVENREKWGKLVVVETVTSFKCLGSVMTDDGSNNIMLAEQRLLNNGGTKDPIFSHTGY